MDYRIKAVDVPSLEDAIIRKGQKDVSVNGLLFGYSDRLQAIVSQPCREADCESFLRAGGYVVIDAVTGEEKATKPRNAAVDVEEAVRAELKRQAEERQKALDAQRAAGGDAHAAYAAEFKKKWDSLPDGEARKAKFGKDELLRAATALKLAVPNPSEATKAQLVELIGAFYADEAQRAQAAQTQGQAQAQG
ncbi:hypothetical protein [Calidithermus chliarophilus]|uniref:hypothetical protein n=1 Tax=Calidithermus chliarophilus TaxID=52023 RepID=UPI00040DF177|nr:hypothetical protein [Calidithermus chliarophilus]